MRIWKNLLEVFLPFVLNSIKMLSRNIEDYHFLADNKTGVTFRWGKTFDDNPTFAPVPELADISISNRCTKECDFCYRASTPDGSLMSVSDYCDVLDSMNSPEYGNVFQVALGGGEPLEHQEFFTIIEETVKRGIVPNITTNGTLLTKDVFAQLKGKVGAIAISITDINNLNNYQKVLQFKDCVRTNVHYILSQGTIGQALDIVEGRYNKLLTGINAVVFLTYKPAGRGGFENVLKTGDVLNKFLNIVKSPKTICKIGFDACFVPMLLRNSQGIDDFVDFCEGGFFSVYINEKKEVSPCSFSNGQDSFSLNEYDFYDIWLNRLQPYRDRIKNHCVLGCNIRHMCKGACPYFPEITNCYKAL